MAMKFHHVGVACSNIHEEIENIKQLHKVISISPIVQDLAQNAELCILQTEEGVPIELIAGEQVKNLLKKRISYYHLCFETDNLENEINRILDLGGILVSEPKNAILFNYKRVAFLQVSYGLIELLEIFKSQE